MIFEKIIMIYHKVREVCFKCNEFHPKINFEDIGFKCNENEKIISFNKTSKQRQLNLLNLKKQEK